MSIEPGILARGPWSAADVRAAWSDEPYVATAEHEAAADDAIAALAERGSPSHDGLAARMASFDASDGLSLELQPVRWSLRLVGGDALSSFSVQCVVRDGDGRWLAGRRAAWVATWAGRWTLGAAGAVEVGEEPYGAMLRELEEEWSIVPERANFEFLFCTPNRHVLFVGQAWVPAGTKIVRDPEHDADAWWPPDPEDWPAEAEGPVRYMATMLR